MVYRYQLTEETKEGLVVSNFDENPIFSDKNLCSGHPIVSLLELLVNSEGKVVRQRDLLAPLRQMEMSEDDD